MRGTQTPVLYTHSEDVSPVGKTVQFKRKERKELLPFANWFQSGSSILRWYLQHMNFHYLLSTHSFFCFCWQTATAAAQFFFKSCVRKKNPPSVSLFSRLQWNTTFLFSLSFSWFLFFPLRDTKVKVKVRVRRRRKKKWCDLTLWLLSFK